MNKSTVIILPESDEKTLCVELAGTIRRADHERVIRKGLFERFEKNGSYNLMAYFGPDFKGWEPDAADISMQTIVEIGRHAHRLAFVNPPEKKVMQSKLTPHLFGGELRHFADDDLKEAITWVKG